MLEKHMQGFKVANAITLAKQGAAGFFQVDKPGAGAISMQLEKHMLGIQTVVDAISVVQRAYQRSSRANQHANVRDGQPIPALEPFIQRRILIQRTSQQNGLRTAINAALGKERRLQGGNALAGVLLNCAKLTGKGRLTEGAMQGARAVVVLAFEIEVLRRAVGIIQLKPVHTAPASPAGVWRIHSFELQRPQCVHRIKSVALQYFVCVNSNKGLAGHSRPSKNARVARSCLRSAVSRRALPRYIL